MNDYCIPLITDRENRTADFNYSCNKNLPTKTRAHPSLKMAFLPPRRHIPLFARFSTFRIRDGKFFVSARATNARFFVMARYGNVETYAVIGYSRNVEVCQLKFKIAYGKYILETHSRRSRLIRCNIYTDALQIRNTTFDKKANR